VSKIQKNAIFLLFDLVNFGTFCLIREVFRGSCKTALPGKIDDFEASYKWQQSCHVPFDEVGPSGAGQGEWVEIASKGRFCRANEFCNCLFNVDITATSKYC